MFERREARYAITDIFCKIEFIFVAWSKRRLYIRPFSYLFTSRIILATA